jgi:hypothetical protein
VKGVVRGADLLGKRAVLAEVALVLPDLDEALKNRWREHALKGPAVALQREDDAQRPQRLLVAARRAGA